MVYTKPKAMLLGKAILTSSQWFLTKKVATRDMLPGGAKGFSRPSEAGRSGDGDLRAEGKQHNTKQRREEGGRQGALKSKANQYEKTRP